MLCVIFSILTKHRYFRPFFFFLHDDVMQDHNHTSVSLTQCVVFKNEMVFEPSLTRRFKLFCVEFSCSLIRKNTFFVTGR